MVQTFLRHPLLHFFALGAFLFALFAVVGPPERPVEKPRIVVSEQDARWLVGQFEAAWRRQPNAEELDLLVDEFVREEIYVREALALGLDQGDTIVRRRLRQKMEFLSEAGAEAATPDEATLQAYYHENYEKFSTGARLAFSQVLLPTGRSVDVEAALAALSEGSLPDALAQPTLLPPEIPLSPRQAIDGTFGTGFFERVSALPEGAWGGPVASGYGDHLVRVDQFEQGALPPFEQVRDRVELDWRATMAAELRSARYDQLRDQYDITRPRAIEIVGQ
ncbi:MAG: peptidylprolyl isomerase [Pseudomonadota bacterium]